MEDARFALLTWTLAFIGFAALVVAGGESSWVTLLLATRVGAATIVIAALLSGVREMMRQSREPLDLREDAISLAAPTCDRRAMEGSCAEKGRSRVTGVDLAGRRRR
jgi:hypothetical protein